MRGPPLGPYRALVLPTQDQDPGHRLRETGPDGTALRPRQPLVQLAVSGMGAFAHLVTHGLILTYQDPTVSGRGEGSSPNKVVTAKRQETFGPTA
jgi:hypothetical protein